MVPIYFGVSNSPRLLDKLSLRSFIVFFRVVRLLVIEAVEILAPLKLAEFVLMLFNKVSINTNLSQNPPIIPFYVWEPRTVEISEVVVDETVFASISVL